MPALKNRFRHRLKLNVNITRHFCIISAELVVSSFVNNVVRFSHDELPSVSDNSHHLRHIRHHNSNNINSNSINRRVS